jgi:primary-amine oxidase
MHPLDPLTAAEITATAKLIQSVNPKGSVHFKNISLLEPAKRELRQYLAAERNNAISPNALPAMTRRASSLYYHRGTTDLFLGVVNLTTAEVEKIEKLEEGYHGQADMDEVLEVRAKCLSNPKVVERIKQYGLSDELEVVCDTWPYGRDTDDFTRRLAQVLPPPFIRIVVWE